MHRIARENAIVQCNQDTIGEVVREIGTIPGHHSPVSAKHTQIYDFRLAFPLTVA
ncbi:hypothetical protein BH160DRAFT_6920 [Burkholderia sp. H160]|nr:hypothetical protein BH160DRAFT_6920 [Burkholderia sp. H160]